MISTRRNGVAASDLPYFGFSDDFDTPIGEPSYSFTFNEWKELMDAKRRREEAEFAEAADQFEAKFERKWKYRDTLTKKSWEERLDEVIVFFARFQHKPDPIFLFFAEYCCNSADNSI